MRARPFPRRSAASHPSAQPHRRQTATDNRAPPERSTQPRPLPMPFEPVAWMNEDISPLLVPRSPHQPCRHSCLVLSQQGPEANVAAQGRC
jgi:hypothetical protein